MKVALR